MYCFASNDVYAPQCLQQATAPPMPLPSASPASESASPSSVPFTSSGGSTTPPPSMRRNSELIEDMEVALNTESTQNTEQIFMFFSTTFTPKPDWYAFSASYSWDPLDGFLPQYLPPYPQVAYCAQSLNFRLLDLSYRACYNDLSTTPGRTITRCTKWVDLKQQYYFNDTLPFMPTAIEGNIMLQIQAAQGPFIAAVGVKPDIDTICGSDGTFNLFPPSPSPVTPPPPPPPPTPTPTPKKSTTSTGH